MFFVFLLIVEITVTVLGIIKFVNDIRVDWSIYFTGS
jgi:hypothetical protein